MSPSRHDWQRIAAEISSFRQMYRLAEEIKESELANPVERRAALHVVKTLRDVIDKPIAEASTLAKARRKFGRLLQSLNTAA
jgi:hypothetical protein